MTNTRDDVIRPHPWSCDLLWKKIQVFLYWDVFINLIFNVNIVITLCIRFISFPKGQSLREFSNDEKSVISLKNNDFTKRMYSFISNVGFKRNSSKRAGFNVTAFPLLAFEETRSIPKRYRNYSIRACAAHTTSGISIKSHKKPNRYIFSLFCTIFLFSFFFFLLFFSYFVFACTFFTYSLWNTKKNKDATNLQAIKLLVFSHPRRPRGSRWGRKKI